MRFCQALLGAAPRDWPTIAAAAEAAGFDSVAVSDHVVYPSYLSSKYPYTPDGTPLFSPDEDWPDPWVAIGAMSSVTSTLRFLTNVYVLPLRNPFVVAKAVGTATSSRAKRMGRDDFMGSNFREIWRRERSVHRRLRFPSLAENPLRWKCPPTTRP